MREITIAGRTIGPGHPTFIVAEISANHQQSYDKAVEILRAAKEAGADAVKIQTYTADTMTIESDLPPFKIGGGTLWDGKTLHALYGEAYTPWEWQPKLQDEARALGIPLFSTPFDASAVDFLEKMDVPVHKIASFELVDHALLRAVARTGRPVIMSTGMATLDEITESVDVLRDAGCRELALLKCTSAYPAPPEEMDLVAIPELAEAFDVVVGLSDHTLGAVAPIAAVSLGASIVEKHLCMSRDEPGPDSAFSLEPTEFAAMVRSIRETELALGETRFGVHPREAKSRVFRRSLFVVADVAAGEPFTAQNVRSIRPAHGLAPKFLDEILGRKASRAVARGTPLSWDLVEPRKD